MKSNHELTVELETAVELIDRLLAGNAHLVILERIDDAWNDPKAKTTTAINHGAHQEDEPLWSPEVEAELEDDGQGDPTYRAAVSASQARDVRRRWVGLVNQLARVAEDMARCCEDMADPTPDKLEALRAARNDELTEKAKEWCESCRRAKITSPITLAPDGEPYYANMCRSCGQMLASIKAEFPTEMKHRPYPPKELVVWRHLGRRIYDSHIRAALGIDQVSEEGRKRADRFKAELRQEAKAS